MPVYFRVAKSCEIQPGTVKRIEAGGKQIALFNIDGTFHGMDDGWTHGRGDQPPAPHGVAIYPSASLATTSRWKSESCGRDEIASARDVQNCVCLVWPSRQFLDGLRRRQDEQFDF